jgi:hypothetical protein
MFGMAFGIFEAEQGFVGGKVLGPAGSFAFGTLLGTEEKIGDVGEAGSAFVGDAIGGEGVKEFAEDVVDVDLGDVIVGEAADFAGKILFAGFLFKGHGAGVIEAETVVFRVGGKAAHASIGEGELTEVEGVGRSRVTHKVIIS